MKHLNYYKNKNLISVDDVFNYFFKTIIPENTDKILNDENNLTLIWKGTKLKDKMKSKVLNRK